MGIEFVLEALWCYCYASVEAGECIVVLLLRCSGGWGVHCGVIATLYQHNIEVLMIIGELRA